MFGVGNVTERLLVDVEFDDDVACLAVLMLAPCHGNGKCKQCKHVGTPCLAAAPVRARLRLPRIDKRKDPEPCMGPASGSTPLPPTIAPVLARPEFACENISRTLLSSFLCRGIIYEPSNTSIAVPTLSSARLNPETLGPGNIQRGAL